MIYTACRGDQGKRLCQLDIRQSMTALQQGASLDRLAEYHVFLELRD